MILFIFYFLSQVIAKKKTGKNKSNELCRIYGIGCHGTKGSEKNGNNDESSIEPSQNTQDQNMEKLSMKSFHFSRPELKMIKNQKTILKMLESKSSEEHSSDASDEIDDEEADRANYINLERIKDPLASTENSQPDSDEEDPGLQQERKAFSYKQKLGNLIDILNKNNPNQNLLQKNNIVRKRNFEKPIDRKPKKKKSPTNSKRQGEHNIQAEKYGSVEEAGPNPIDNILGSNNEPTKDNITVDVKARDSLTLSVPKYEIKIKPQPQKTPNESKDGIKDISKNNQLVTKPETTKPTHPDKSKKEVKNPTNKKTNEFLENLNQQWKKLKEENEEMRIGRPLYQ